MDTKKIVAACVAISIISSPIAANAQLGQALGGALGAAIGGNKGGVGGALAGAVIGVAMGTILEQLTAAEKNQRQSALNSAARGGRSSWTTKGKNGKRASYQKVGSAETANGQKCQKVKETITMADGKQGTSVETVCFAS